MSVLHWTSCFFRVILCLAIPKVVYQAALEAEAHRVGRCIWWLHKAAVVCLVLELFGIARHLTVWADVALICTGTTVLWVESRI